MSHAYFLSIEFQQTGYLVERIYKTAYGNGSGTSTFGGTHQLPVPIVRFKEFLRDTQQIGQGVVVGQAGWETALESNKQAFTADFVQLSRFTTTFSNSMTPAQFADALNGSAGNPLSASERNQLVNELSTNAKTRAQVLRTIAEHPSLFAAESNRAFVLMQYFGYLRRNPNDAPDADYTGYDFWLTKLNQFSGNFVNAEMVKAFITSSEYRARFGSETVARGRAAFRDSNLTQLGGPGCPWADWHKPSDSFLYFHKSSASAPAPALLEVLDRYDALFGLVAQRNPPNNLPPILSSNVSAALIESFSIRPG